MARIKNDGVVYITVTLTYMLFSQVSISFGKSKEINGPF